MSEKIKPEEITSILQRELQKFPDTYRLEEVGTILQVGDGVATVYGLSQAQTGEEIIFENQSKGLVFNLEEDSVGVVILAPDHLIKAGEQVKRTGRRLAVEVSEHMVGRVIDTLGHPLDGKGPVQAPFFSMPLERKAPEVIYRQKVKEPLQTGIKAIDSMTAIGRGQRQLIIGDRQTGKTSICIDTILNQRVLFEQGNPIYCFYVAVGQKASSIARVIEVLTQHGAMDYTTIIAAPADSPAPLQFLAPSTGTALAEFFRDTGRHALVVYDDLSKQADAYREVSLLLRRPPGREAYPGDIFYLHARLLERTARINDTDAIALRANDLPASLEGKVKGGGSITSLAIIEMKGGDVSAYIPTNVISITDGQIFLNKDLFNAGIRPAINVGISVSRVGGAAQINSMKKAAGTLKLNLAEFFDLENFTGLGADLDEATQRIINRGKKIQEILKQPLHNPLPVAQQVAIIYVSMQGYIDSLPLCEIEEFETKYLAILAEKHDDVLKQIAAGVWDKHIQKILQQEANNLVKTMSS